MCTPDGLVGGDAGPEGRQRHMSMYVRTASADRRILGGQEQQLTCCERNLNARSSREFCLRVPPDSVCSECA